jgi:hypothetical protein
MNPGGALAVSPLVANSITPSAETKRMRVIAFTMTRSRSMPVSASDHAAGREP